MAYRFGLKECSIAAWNNPESYGTAQALSAIQLFEVTVQTVNGVLEGNDSIVDVHAQFISVQVRARFGFNTLEVYEILSGATVVNSDDRNSLMIDPRNAPYFAICGRMLDTQGAGDLHCFIPKCKLTEGFTIGSEYGRYMTPEVTIMGVDEGTDTYWMIRWFEHDTAQAITIPPT